MAATRGLVASSLRRRKRSERHEGKEKVEEETFFCRLPRLEASLKVSLEVSTAVKNSLVLSQMLFLVIFLFLDDIEKERKREGFGFNSNLCAVCGGRGEGEQSLRGRRAVGGSTSCQQGFPPFAAGRKGRREGRRTRRLRFSGSS